jgi:hypothetical protein
MYKQSKVRGSLLLICYMSEIYNLGVRRVLKPVSKPAASIKKVVLHTYFLLW